MAKNFQPDPEWDLFDAFIASVLFAITIVAIGWVSWEAIGEPLWRFAKW